MRVLREFESHSFRQEPSIHAGSKVIKTSTPHRTRLRICACLLRVNSMRCSTLCTRSHQRGHAARPAFLIGLRCALWVSPPNIPAFVLPALECRSVCAALLRPAHVPGSCMASASQLMVSALWRRKGVGSLAHRAGTAVACGSAWHRVCAAGQRMQVQINSIPVCCKPIKFILVVFKLKPAAIWAKED